MLRTYGNHLQRLLVKAAALQQSHGPKKSVWVTSNSTSQQICFAVYRLFTTAVTSHSTPNEPEIRQQQTENNLDLNVVCRVCKQTGHSARNCPQVRGICHRCGNPDHLAYNCPEPKTCYKCGSKEHLARNCPHNVCYRCMKTGHTAADCTEGKTCYRCGKTGHIARDCPDMRVERAQIKAD